MAITNTPLEVVQARGPQGVAGEVSTAALNAAITALKGGATAGADTLGEIEALLALKAPLNGAALTNATTTTQAAGNNSTKLATTAFVQQELSNDLLNYQPLDGLLTSLSSLSVTMSGFVLYTSGVASIVTLDTDGTLAGNSNTRVPSQAAVKTYSDARETAAKAYADTLVVGLLDDRGNWDASGNLFPSGTGSGSAGAVLKGDLWTISVAGTLGGQDVTAGDVVRALVNTPGQTAGNWVITENNFGYVAENSANKDADGTLAANSDQKYPSQKAIKTYASNASNISSGTLAAARMAAFGSGDVSFATAGGAGTIANDAVTYAKMQNVSATSRLLGRVTAGAGDPEEVVLDVDGTFAANSDSRVATQKAVKTYADGLITALRNGVSASYDTLAEIATWIGLVEAAWTAFSGSPTAGSGTFTSASYAGRYRVVGKTVQFALTVTITTVGTASGVIIVPLPSGTPVRDSVAMCKENSLTNAAGTGYINTGGTIHVIKYDGASLIAAATNILVCGEYEKS